MTSVPLGVGAYKRNYGQEPTVEVLNRFFEQTPTNQVEGSVLLSRPGTTFEVSAGFGPYRVADHQQGAFNDDLFFVMNDTLYRYDGVNAPIAIAGTIAGTGTPDTTIVSGPDYEHFFIADGVTLQYYDGEAAATGTLTVAGGTINDTDTLEISTVYYAWTAGSVDAGSPDGSMANPWLVALGVSDTEALANMLNALNATGTAGVTYSTALTANLNVLGRQSTATTLSVAARERGTSGNSITTTSTGANISWGNPTLEGGGSQSLNGVPVPDDQGVVTLTNLASFVLVGISNSQRFYWILPAETTIDPLNFAEAESEPDDIIQMIRVGDSFYIFGQTSTEVWYATGDADTPFAPNQGLAFSQGVIEGSAVEIRTQVITIAEDLKVYSIVGGPRRISNSGIEERIRLAIAAQS